jgi:hypothetical protein
VLTKKLEESAREIRKVRQELEESHKRKSTSDRDFSQQVDTLKDEAEEAEHLRSEAAYVNEQLLCLFSESQTPTKSCKTADNLIDMCRAYVQSTNTMIGHQRHEIQSLAEKLESQNNLLTTHAQEEKEILEEAHQSILSTLKKSHKVELANQRKTYESRVSHLESRNTIRLEELERELGDTKAQLCARQPVKDVNSIQELLVVYPILMANYRSQIEKTYKRNSEDLKALKQDHLISIRQQEQSFQLQKDKYKERHALDTEALNEANSKLEKMKCDHEELIRSKEEKWQSQIEILKKHHQDEISSITTRIKEQCSAAYDSALAKLKKEYFKVEQRLHTQRENQKVRHPNREELEEYKKRIKILEVRTQLM